MFSIKVWETPEDRELGEPEMVETGIVDCDVAVEIARSLYPKNDAVEVINDDDELYYHISTDMTGKSRPYIEDHRV